MTQVLNKYRLIKVVLPEEYMPTSALSQLHNSIKDKLHNEVLNREYMRKLVENEIMHWNPQVYN